MKKHAFLILAHKQPKLLARILRILEKENHFFFIHVDKKTSNIEHYINESKDIRNVFFLHERIKVYHAGISIVYAELALLKEAFSFSTPFDYYHLISGQDYPLRSNLQFDNFFENTNQSFVYFDDDEFAKSMEKNYKMSADEFHFNKTTPFFVKVYKKMRIGKFLSIFYHRRPIPFYAGGWQWFSWSQKTTQFVFDYIDKHPEYIKRFNHTASPDEHIFVTLLKQHSQELDIKTQDPLRYISWHPHRQVSTNYRPYNLNELDYDYVINSRAFFCRKIDEKESEKLLDLIDAQRDNPYDIEKHTNFV